MAVTKWIIPLATRPLGRTATSANSHVKIQDLKGQQPNRDLHSRSTPKWSEGIECTVFTSKMRIYANKQETVVCEITDNWGDFTDVCCDFTDVCRDFTDNGVPTRSVGLHKSTTFEAYRIFTGHTRHKPYCVGTSCANWQMVEFASNYFSTCAMCCISNCIRPV